MRLFIVLSILVAVLAACDTSVPNPPPITVVITAVDDTTALADGVAQALTGTALNSVALTETEFARQGITLTPTLTATPTHTPPEPSPTRPGPPTATYTPSITPTPTFAPFATNAAVTDPAPQSDDGRAGARLRVLNAWVQFDERIDARVDVYINDVRVAHALDVRQVTTYQRVSAGAARVSLYPVLTDPALQLASPPLLSQAVTMGAGGSMSLVMADLGDGLTLIPVMEDASPLPSGMSRFTLLQANPLLLETNILVPDARRELVTNLNTAEIVGPVDLPRDNYRLEMYDSVTPELFLGDISGINLTGQVNHLLVLVPQPPDSVAVTDSILFMGSTHLVPTDVNVRFINAATETGSLGFGWDNFKQIPALGVGEMSGAVPVSSQGTPLNVMNTDGDTIEELQLGPWTGDQSDKLVVILNAPENADVDIAGVTFSQDAPTSAIRANVRLINVLPDTVPLALETALVGAQEVEDDPWEVLAANVRYGEGSDYAGRAPGLYDVRVILTGSDTQIVSLAQIQLLAGATYQFIVVPGTEPGSASLLMVQPEVQIGLAAADLPGAVEEIVMATLTAMVTPDANTPTIVRTPTPTISPVPTNTAYPTSTPDVPPPALLIDPAPPNTTEGTFTLIGVNFEPGRRYGISVDGGPELTSGQVAQDGSLINVITLPANTAPGPHIVQVCVDCEADGSQQAEYIVVVVADPSVTPTPTRIP